MADGCVQSQNLDFKSWILKWDFSCFYSKMKIDFANQTIWLHIQLQEVHENQENIIFPH